MESKVGVVKKIEDGKAYVSVIGIPGWTIIDGQSAMREGESFNDIRPNTVVTFKLLGSPRLTESGYFEAHAADVTTKRILTD